MILSTPYHNQMIESSSSQINQFMLSGRKFGRLLVLERSDEWYTYPNGDRDFKWVCQCDCGNIVVTRGNVLRNSRFKQSCGCWRMEESILDEDMIDRKFGLCRVVARANRIHVGGNATVDAWTCDCACGNRFVARGPQLRIGNVISCGCASTSKWEVWLGQFLDEHGFIYSTQKFYSDLRGIGYGYLTYDFCVNTSVGDVLIECQGNQHYFPVDYFGGQTSFEKQVEHDRRKREYAETHGIRLIEIDCSDYHMKQADYMKLLDSVFVKYDYFGINNSI